MNKYIFISLFFIFGQILYAQVFSFDMSDGDNASYLVKADITDFKVSVTKNFNIVFNEAFYRYKQSIDHDEVGFAFSNQEDPSMNGLDDQSQYFRIILSTDVKAIQYNDLTKRDHIVLYPKDETKFKSEFQNLIKLLNLQETTKTISTYQNEANRGNHYAEYKVGQCYQYGVGVKKNENEAFKWFKMSADGGYVFGLKEVGLCYMNGLLGVNRNLKEALKWLFKAAEKGDAWSQYHYAFWIRDDKTMMSKALEWFRRSANQGYEPAQTAVAQCFQYGWGTSVDGELACKYFKKSAEQGNPSSMHQLALLYYSGDLVPMNRSETKRLLLEAAGKDYAPSQTQLGMFYLDDSLGKRDEKEAFRWLYKAAEKKYVKGQLYLGICYMKGYGTKKNKQKAREYLRMAADQGDKDALLLLNKL